MKAMIVSAGFFVVLAAGCSAPVPTDSDSRRGSDPERDETSPIESSSGTIDSRKPSPPNSNPTPNAKSDEVETSAACSELSGFWSGPLEGTYVDLLDPTNPAKQQPVLGTATAKIVPGTDGKIALGDDSKLKIILKKILPGGGDATIDKPFTGGGTCAELDGASGGDTGLIKVDVKATCKFSQASCPGTWTATSGGKPVASGTFTLSKKP
jgi:hypothetical protein